MDNLTTLVHILLQFQLSVKLYHWQTHRYARHIASGNLVDQLSKNIDRLVEALQGTFNKRIKFTPKCNLSLENISDTQMKTILSEFSDWLNKDFESFVKGGKYILTIRDEIMTDVNQALYLFTLD